MTAHRIRRIFLLLLLPLLIVVAIVYLYWVSEEQEGGLRASGTVETVEVVVAPEVTGKIAAVMVSEGDRVSSGDVLLRLDDSLLQAQRERAAAAVKTAKAGLQHAQANLELVSTQVEITLRAARLEDKPTREEAWEETSPSEFELPLWYFTKPEEIRAVEVEIQTSQQELEHERQNLENLLGSAAIEDLRAAEERLADARASFLIAETVLERARRAREDQELEDFAEQQYDAAKDELEAAQSDYEQLLSDKDAEDILEARARLAVAQEGFDHARDRLAELQSGDYSLQLQVVERNLDQARSAVMQAEAVLEQAKAELALIDLQLEKLVLYAPIDGVVATRNVELGEVLQAGASALTLHQLDQLTMTVYVPEDRYGAIRLGQHVVVTVDSFPDETYSATVVRIADQAEYTPRNVQTDEGRRTTVFAIELTLDDPSGRLKPGMPADVDFGP